MLKTVPSLGITVPILTIGVCGSVIFFSLVVSVGYAQIVISESYSTIPNRIKFDIFLVNSCTLLGAAGSEHLYTTPPPLVGGRGKSPHIIRWGTCHNRTPLAYNFQ
jgi:hypothetical protein